MQFHVLKNIDGDKILLNIEKLALAMPVADGDATMAWLDGGPSTAVAMKFDDFAKLAEQALKVFTTPPQPWFDDPDVDRGTR